MGGCAPILLQRRLDELVIDEDALAMEVLPVEQVLPRPVLHVVLAHLPN